MDHSIAELDRANRLYLASIELARAAYRLEPGFRCSGPPPSRRACPRKMPRFVYTGGRDKYSWRGAEPAKLRALAAQGPRPPMSQSLIVAAAHGAIMPGLLLAEYLELPLYFIRFSMFKRKDEAPILSVSDEVWLSSWREKASCSMTRTSPRARPSSYSRAVCPPSSPRRGAPARFATRAPAFAPTLSLGIGGINSGISGYEADSRELKS